MSHTFYILDVFAESKYAGNQLAVVRNAGDISDDEMQQIAREMNYSETTFILSDDARNGGYDVRIFTPGGELPFAGHPTLGTSWIVQNEILQKPSNKVVLNLKVGPIPVTFHEDGNLWMRQVEPQFGKIWSIADIAPALRLNESDFDDRFPIQEVSTGFYAFMIPLKTLDAVKRAKVEKELYFEICERTEGKGFLIFCPEPYSADNHLHARFFIDYLGIPEDPATGSANGCLAGWLVKHRYFGERTIDIRVEQGYEMKRPSILNLRASEQNGSIDVNVGGRVVKVAEGKLI